MWGFCGAMSQATSTPVITRFVRHPQLPGINLETPHGPAKIRPIKNGWHTFAIVRGTAIGKNFPKLRPALICAMQLRGVMSSGLVNSIENIANLPTE